MKRYITLLPITILICIVHCSIAQTKFIEKITADGTGLVIPYEKYVLSNGLTVIVHEDHTDPIVHVDVTYHVGSAREEIGKSGFAHFFEHMMFEGSEHVGNEQHHKIIEEAGGTNNGATYRDKTHYYETVPSNQLEKVLWLEADRMGFLLDSVTQRKFELQRATVKNEKAEGDDNVPYGLVDEIVNRNLYPYGHPYSWNTIGSVEDLDRVNVQDLKNFFLRWYGPNNAVLTIGGDVNTAEVIKMVEKYFGPIPKGPDVQPIQVPIPVLKEDRYVSMVDNYAKLPQLRIVYPCAGRFSEDELALDCLAWILSQGKGFFSYREMISKQQALEASVSYSSDELAGEFEFNITPYADQELEDVLAIIKETLKEFYRRGAIRNDFLKYRAEHLSQLLKKLESVSAKVNMLAEFQTYTGNPNYLTTEINKYNKIKASDVWRVYKKYLRKKHAVVLSVLPQGRRVQKAADDNFTVSKEGYVAPNYGYDGLKYVKCIDTFDRNIMPPIGPMPIIKVPKFWKRTLSGNISVIGTQTNEIPEVTMEFHFKGGKIVETGDANKAGMLWIFTQMMETDTKNFTEVEFYEFMQKLGSSINVSYHTDGVDVTVRTFSKNIHKTMSLLAERILRPNFTIRELEIFKRSYIERIKNSQNNADFIANCIYNKIIFGEDNIFGRMATEESIKRISLQDMENYYKKYFSKNGAEVAIVGDISEEDAIDNISFLQKMSDKKLDITTSITPPIVEKTKIYFVNIPNAAQTEFRIGYATDIKYDPLGEYYLSSIMNYPLGGNFNSRLNLALRENKGWTYYAQSNFKCDKYLGSFTFSAGIKTSATDSALREVIHILKEYRDSGMSQEELLHTQRFMILSEAGNYETEVKKASFLNYILRYNLPVDFAKKQNDILNNIRKEELLLLAKKRLPDTDKMNIVLVGDKAEVWNSLQKIGYEVVELDKEGNPIKE